MFALCDNMKWAHLPCAGGLLDQDPDFLDKMKIIFGLRNSIQAEEQRKREAEANKAKGGGVKRPSSRGSVRRRR